MAIIGNNVHYTGYGSSTSAYQASKFQASVDGKISSIFVYVQLGNYSGRSIAVGIYNDNSGAIGTHINHSVDTAVSALQDGWMEISIPTVNLTSGNYYWLVVQRDPSLGGYTWWIASGSSNQRGNKASFTYPYWDDNPTGISYDNTKNEIYAEITEISTKTKTILSTAKIFVGDNQKTINSDALITISHKKEITSNAKIRAIGIEETILSDSKIVDLYQKTITSDAKIKVTGIQKTILSDAKIVIQVLYNINDKINTVLQELKNITNDNRMVKRILSDVDNFISTVKRLLYDTNNDFRTQKRTLYNVNNDFRFLLSWQKAANGIFQSLGKEYIKVYIGGVEQTDVDVNSINIGKDLNTSHTASFDLGRAYDATKPTMESVVLIKYNDWTLYSGYITQISPADDPEKMRINCQDEYWKQNKTNKYYQVGHKPADNQELFYDTIKVALSTAHSFNQDIGDFVPQTINNFATGSSDCISTLIQDSGNFGWFYEVDGSKKLWIAGQGTTIEIKRQALGSNLGLYDLISHSFSEDIESIVNKFRVQMGEKVIRKFDSSGGSRTYTGYNYSSYNQFVTPAWDDQYEVLAKDSAIGYGWDYHKPEDAENYKDVFKKYYMPYLNPKLSSWSDRYPPYVEIYSESSIFGAAIGRLYEGFTIDYENKLIQFSNPIYQYNTNSKGEITDIRAAAVKVFLWKKDFWTYTTDPTDDPESDIANPLMFFTAKMGTYADTILKDLNLSSLSVQVGGTRYLEDGSTEIVPSWDDTEFAEDYADWQLSKNCDKKIRGRITLTLDAVCFYNIDLTKRIYIDGITDEAMNITSMSYDVSNFTVILTLENSRYYKRSVSLQSRGE